MSSSGRADRHELWLAAAAVALGGSALGVGAGTGIVLLAFAAGLAVQALRVRGLEADRVGVRLVGSGVVTGAAAVLGCVAGARSSAALAALVGLGLVVRGVRHSLAGEPLAEVPGAEGASGPGLGAAVAADLGMRAVWELGSALRGRGRWERWAEEAHALAERNARCGWIEEPERAHPLPPPLEKPRVRRRHGPLLGDFEHLRFESDFGPPDPEESVRFLERARNREAHAFLWRHSNGPRPTLLCIHGFGMGRVALDVWRWDVAWLHRSLGLDVVLAVLPLHGPRAPLGISGLGFFDVGPAWTSAALAQSLWDVRRIAGWLRSQGVPTLGVHGLSLGGHLAAVHASLDPGLAAAIPMNPAVSLADLWWRELPARERADAEHAGLTRDRLEQAWAPHAPLRHRPRVARERRLIVAARADRIVPAAQVRALWEHWDRPTMHWVPGTHQVWLGRDALRARMAAHLRATLWTGETSGADTLSHFRLRSRGA